MLGWPAIVEQIDSVDRSLPVVDRNRAVIFTEDYSEAGAVDFYGPALGLPSTVSGHNSFWLWGYGHPTPGAVVIAVGLPSSLVHRYWSSVTQAATLGRPVRRSTHKNALPPSGCVEASSSRGRPSGRRQSTTTDRSSTATEPVAHGALRGEVRSHVDVSLLVNQPFGLVWHRMLVGHDCQGSPRRISQGIERCHRLVVEVHLAGGDVLHQVIDA